MKPRTDIFTDLGACPKDNRWWIGVDFDGTLAKSASKYVGPEYTGEPVLEMLWRVKEWIAMGYRVKIFTARASVPEQIPAVEKWLEEQGLGELEITNVKDYLMMELWDDRCVQVVENVGIPVAGSRTRVPLERDYDK